MIRQSLAIISFVLINCYLVVYGKHVIEWTGCDAYNRYIKMDTTSSLEDCMILHTDIQPEIFMKKVTSEPTAQSCKKLCKNTPKCKYFTFVFGDDTTTSNTVATLPICYLKTAPSYSTSPVLIVRSYDPTEVDFKYVSGPVDGCNQKCTEETPVSPGCYGASPVTCSALRSKFSSDCVHQNLKENCIKSSYACCETGTSTHKDLYYQDRTVLINGNQVKTIFKGVWSPEECYSLCISTPSCTAWNFVISPITSVIGGACYMKFYSESETKRVSSAPLDVTTAVTAQNCLIDGNCAIHTTTDWSFEPFDSKYALAYSCFYSNLYFENRLKITYSEITPERCQHYCKKTKGCRFFIKKASFCQLSFSNVNYAPLGSEHDSSIVGPSDCGHIIPSDECSLNGKGFVGTKIGVDSYKHDAQICHTNCNEYGGTCVGWTYEGTTCSLFKDVTNVIQKPNAISAYSNCDMFTELEQLDLKDNPPTPPPTRLCSFSKLIYSSDFALSQSALQEPACVAHCKTHSDCVAVTHVYDGGFNECTLYRTTQNKRPTIATNKQATTTVLDCDSLTN